MKDDNKTLESYELKFETVKVFLAHFVLFIVMSVVGYAITGNVKVVEFNAMVFAFVTSAFCGAVVCLAYTLKNVSATRKSIVTMSDGESVEVEQHVRLVDIFERVAFGDAMDAANNGAFSMACEKLKSTENGTISKVTES